MKRGDHTPLHTMRSDHINFSLNVTLPYTIVNVYPLVSKQQRRFILLRSRVFENALNRRYFILFRRINEVSHSNTLQIALRIDNILLDALTRLILFQILTFLNLSLEIPDLED